MLESLVTQFYDDVMNNTNYYLEFEIVSEEFVADFGNGFLQ